MEEKQNQNVNRLIQYCIKLREQYLSLWRDILHVMKCKKKIEDKKNAIFL